MFYNFTAEETTIDVPKYFRLDAIVIVNGTVITESSHSLPSPVVFDQCWMHHVGKGQLHISTIDIQNARVPSLYGFSQGTHFVALQNAGHAVLDYNICCALLRRPSGFS
jgi:hypothetical protein